MAKRKKELTYGTFVIIVLAATGFFIAVDRIIKFYNDHPALFWFICSLFIAAILFAIVVVVKRRFFD